LGKGQKWSERQPSFEGDPQWGVGANQTGSKVPLRKQTRGEKKQAGPVKQPGFVGKRVPKCLDVMEGTVHKGEKG